MTGLTFSLALALAAATPVAADPDDRLRQVDYDPAAVFTLAGCIGFQTLVRFPPDEHIEVITVGNSFDWQVIPNQRGSLMTVKATRPSSPSKKLLMAARMSLKER